MTSARLRGVVAIAVATVVGCGGAGFTPPPPDTPPDEAIDMFVTAGGMPAVAVTVIDGGETLYTKVAGVRKKGDPTPVGDGDAFHIGSNTKAMTALIAGTVVDAGQISWDSTVGDVLTGVIVPGAYADVTLTQLLSHTSGMPEIDAATELAFNLSTEPTNVQRRSIAQEAVAAPPASTPGTTFFYSNVNYVVAGLMLEVATGKSWESLLQERLFTPLGMTSAGFGVPATAHTTDAPWGHDPIPLDPAVPDIAPGFGPAGTVHASVGDLLPYLTMYMDGGVGPNGRIISEASLAAIETPRLEHYGFGWTVGRFGDGTLVMAHSGSNGNFFAHFILFPERRAAVVVMTNRGDMAFWNRAFEVIGYLVHHFGLPERQPFVD